MREHGTAVPPVRLVESVVSKRVRRVSVSSTATADGSQSRTLLVNVEIKSQIFSRNFGDIPLWRAKHLYGYELASPAPPDYAYFDIGNTGVAFSKPGKDRPTSW